MSKTKGKCTPANRGAIAIAVIIIALTITLVMVACERPGAEAPITSEPKETEIAPPEPAPEPKPESPPEPQVLVYGNTAANINNGGTAAIQGDWIYYVSNDDGKMYAIKTDGSGLRKVNDDPTTNINVVGDWIYYADQIDRGTGGNIYAIKTDGSERRIVYDGNDKRVLELVVVNDWIYYRDTDFNIKAISTDGNGLRKITEPTSGMIVDGDWIYYNDWSVGGGLYAIKTDGTQLHSVSNEGVYNFLLNGWFYYMVSVEPKNGIGSQDNGDDVYWPNNICAIKTDSSEKRTILETNGVIWSINTDGEWVYYSNPDDGDKIYAIKPDGSEKRKVNDDRSVEINIVGDWIYYSNIAGGDDEKSYLLTYAVKTDGTGRHLVRHKDTTIGIVKTSGEDIKIWDAPGADGNWIGDLKDKTEIAIKGEANGFYIISGGILALHDLYISSDFVDIIETIE